MSSTTTIQNENEIDVIGWKEALKLSCKGSYGYMIAALFGIVISSGTNLMFPTIIGLAVDRTQSPKFTNSKSNDLMLALAVFCTGATGSLLRVYSLGVAQNRIASEIRIRIVDGVFKEHNAYKPSHELNVAIAGIVSDPDDFAAAICKTATGLYRGFNSALGGSILLLRISPQLTMVSLSLLPFVGISAIAFGKRSRRKAKSWRAKVQDEISRVSERISNISTVILFGNEEYERKRFAQGLQVLKSESKSVALAEGIFMAGLSLGINLSLIAVVGYGGAMVANNHLTAGQLTSFGLYSGMVGLGFSQLSACYGDFSKALGASHRLRKLMTLSEHIVQNEKEFKRCFSSAAREQHVVQKLTVKVQNVSFSYTHHHSQHPPVIQDVSFELHPGRLYALAGASGAGKSTMLSLLSRLRNPVSGAISFNDRDIRTIPITEYRSTVTVIQQNPVLFDDLSVFENIRYGSPDATLEEIKRASTLACIDDVLDHMPLGPEVSLKDNNLTLSAGEIQRIALARAFVRKSSLVLFDEVTSSVDGRTEQRIQESLRRLVNSGVTVLVVAHRETSLHSADEILVLEQGTITERGGFEELKQDASSRLSRLLCSKLRL